MAIQKLRISRWDSGLMTDLPPYMLPPDGLQKASGVSIDSGIPRLPAGWNHAIYSPSANALALMRYVNASASYAVYSTSTQVVARNEATFANTILSSATPTPTRFVQMYDKLIWCDGGGALYQWTGTGAAQPLGVFRPLTPPSVGVISGGNLDTTGGLAAYRWAVTFVRADGTESNPSPLSIGLSQAGFQCLLSVPTSDSGLTTARNIYRIGGRLARLTLVGTLAGDIASAYTDNLADSGVGTVQANYARDPPPTGIEKMVVAKNRLILSKGDTLYVSSLGSPSYFPATVYDPLIDGRIFSIDPDYRNPIIALGWTGSAVIIARKKNLYLLQGDDSDSFVLTKICDVGCAAERSLVQCGTVTMWLAPDGMVYALGAGGLTRASQQIRRTLKAVPLSARAAACACYFDGRYHLCIPNAYDGSPYCLYLTYNLETGAWTDYSYRWYQYTGMYAETGIGDAEEIWGTPGAQWLSESGGTSGGILGYFGAASTSHEQKVTIQTADLEMGEPEVVKRAVTLRIRGVCTPGSSSSPNQYVDLYATYDKKDGTQQISTRQYALNTTAGVAGVIFHADLDSSLVGQRISIKVSGGFDAFELHDMTLWYELQKDSVM